MRALGLGSLLLIGCGHLSLDTKWAPAELLAYDAAQYPDDAAVGLYAEDGRLIARKSSEDSYTQVLYHRAYAIQNESAFDLAEVRIPLYGKNKLVALRARHLKPDGTVREVLPSEIIVDESESKDGKSTNGRVFRFPNVEVGSVLEWVYVIELPFFDTDDESDSFGEYPMRRYDAWIEASKEAILEGRFYNIPAQADAGPGRDQFLRISASVRDIPSRPKREEYAADWTFTQPRWAYRMLRWNFGGHVYPVLQTWTDVLGRWAWRAWATSKDTLLERFDERLDVSGCADPKCRAERARAWVREHTEYSGVGSFGRMRKASEIVSSREASSFERGLLLRRLLEDAGTTASLAAYTSRHTEQVDPSFPNLERLNRLLVYLPPQPGLEHPLWIDPSCEHCAPGQVSDEAKGVTALVFRARILPIGEPEYASDERVVDAAAYQAPTRVLRYEAALADSGDLHLDISDERSGRFAANHCAELRGTSRLQRLAAARRDLLAVAPTAKLEGLADYECKSADALAVERRSVVLPRHAVADGDRLLVPLTLLDPLWASLFVEDKRVQPIAFEAGDRKTELVVHLKTPPGWSLDSAGRRETADAPGMHAAFEVEPMPGGAQARLSLAIEAGYHPASGYPEFKKLGDFVRAARTRVIELKKR